MIPLYQFIYIYIFFSFYSLIPTDVNLVTVLRHLKRDAVTHVKMLEKLIEGKVGLYPILMTSSRYSNELTTNSNVKSFIIKLCHCLSCG